MGWTVELCDPENSLQWCIGAAIDDQLSNGDGMMGFVDDFDGERLEVRWPRTRSSAFQK